MLIKEVMILDERQKNILKEIVESYIKQVKPVGSKSLCEILNCSSATIRNEMMLLEEFGYIEKAHVSSGRIPSEKGYKYYVENLMKPKELTGEDVLKLQTIFRNQELELSSAVNQCVEIISELTNYTSIVLGKKSEENALQQVNIIPLKENRITAIVCTDQGIVQNKQFTIPSDVNLQEIVKTSDMINKMLVGTPINEVSSRLEFEIKPIISQKVKQYESVYNIFSEAFHDFMENKNEVYFSGKNKIFDAKEFDDIEKIRSIASKFEDESFIKKIESKEEQDGINIYIGDETDFDPNVTIVKTTYKRNGEEGTIAIIGPKRMEYDRVVGLLSYISAELNEEGE